MLTDTMAVTLLPDALQFHPAAALSLPFDERITPCASTLCFTSHLMAAMLRPCMSSTRWHLSARENRAVKVLRHDFLFVQER